MIGCSDVSVKSTFATAAVVDAVVRMSTHATTVNAAGWLAHAVYWITQGTDAVVKTTFATTAFIDAVVRMSLYAATPEIIDNISGVLWWITHGVDASVISMFASASIVDAVARMANATTLDTSPRASLAAVVSLFTPDAVHCNHNT